MDTAGAISGHAPPSDDAAGRSGVVMVNIEYKAPSTSRSWLPLLFFGLLVACTSLLSNFARGRLYVIPLAVVPYALVALVLWVRGRRRTRRAVAGIDADPSSLGERLRELNPHLTDTANCARLVAASGLRGVVLRYYIGDPPPAVAPFPFPFEPYPLGSWNRAVESLSSRAVDRDQASISAKRTRRAMIKLLAFLLTLPLVTLTLLIFKGVPIEKLVLIEAPAVVCVGLVALSMLTSRKLYLIPSGLVEVRRPPLPRWPIHRFVASESVLLMHRGERGLWTWAVADSQRGCAGHTNDATTDAFLRAWLSPLPPPTVELLRGLAGE